MPATLKASRSCGWLLVLLAIGALPARGQSGEPLRLFGYFQNKFRYTEEKGLGAPPRLTSFSMQQLNTLMAKDFTPRFSAFVDVELTNTFSTEERVGSLQLEEAWLRYDHNPALKVKIGLHVPPFNNLNEIKNRTPLLPYIYRPLIYETSVRNVLQITDFVPQRAFLQVYGTLPYHAWRIDYAAFTGNQPTFVTQEGIYGSIPAGTDLSPGLLVGGRMGLRRHSLKMGLSSTFERMQSDDLWGDFPRYRFGADLSFFLRQFYVEAEAVTVGYTLNARQQKQLRELATQNPLRGTDLDQSFLFAMLGYTPTENTMTYVSFSTANDEEISGLEGLYVYSVGGVYRPFPAVALKAQVIKGLLGSDEFVDFSSLNVFAAASVMF